MTEAHISNKWKIELVTGGAEWLDKTYPGWERKIDLSKLNIMDCDNCILGQALRDLVTNKIDSGYHIGTDRLKAENPELFEKIIGAFVHTGCEPVWAELIKERFNTGNFSDAS